MGISYNPRIVTDGIVLALDGANYKSFKGEATTNLIPNPTVNAYPSTGNAWGTFNTNQYNNNTYFSIGTINDVTNNIITTTTAHPLRTYDVVNPQTTGGGVTAGTNYFIKKVSSTSFTIHAYNGSQDGSQGYINPSTGNHKVYDSIANDTRISVNSTSFPTMWYGYAHQPNSGLVKELRYGEFNAIPNLPANDCIRLHYIRTDDVKDGMSYNVDCTVTPSSPVTVSFYTRSANANAVGKVIQYQIYNYGASATGYAMNFTLGAVGVWQRQTYTFTPAYGTMISYWFPVSTTGTYAWDWSCMQVEQKSYVTNFVAGTRGTTVATGGGWADLSGTGNNGTLVNGVRESSDNLGSLLFDGTNDYVSVGVANNPTQQITLESWINPNRIPSTGTIRGGAISGDPNHYLGILDSIDGGATHSLHFALQTSSSRPGSQIGNIPRNVWSHIVGTYDGARMKAYLNGVMVYDVALTGTISGSGNWAIGCYQPAPTDGTHNFDGKISNAKIYNRALTAAEVSQNYNALKGRFKPEYETLTYTASGNLTVTGNGTNTVNIFKTSGGNAWDNQAYSTTTFTAPCTIEFNKQAASGDNGVSYAMIGWNADPLTNASYDTLNYASYPYRTDVYSVYHNGSQVHFSGTWNTANKFYIVYGTDGFIRHYNGSTLLYSVNYGAGNTVYVDSSFYSPNATFGGFSNIKVIRSAWNGTDYV
jgi:hypothetical protein